MRIYIAYQLLQSSDFTVIYCVSLRVNNAVEVGCGDTGTQNTMSAVNYHNGKPGGRDLERIAGFEPSSNRKVGKAANGTNGTNQKW